MLDHFQCAIMYIYEELDIRWSATSRLSFIMFRIYFWLYKLKCLVRQLNQHIYEMPQYPNYILSTRYIFLGFIMTVDTGQCYKYTCIYVFMYVVRSYMCINNFILATKEFQVVETSNVHWQLLLMCRRKEKMVCTQFVREKYL